MRVLPAGMAGKIAGGDFTGENRATTRVTIQKVQLGVYQNVAQVYSTPIFPVSAQPARELPNVKSYRDDRSVDTEIASATMELFNTRPLPPGVMPPVGDVFDLLGYYTYNRGRSTQSPSVWNQIRNHWQDMLVPDRLVRVYQGYGEDYTVAPENDPNLILTGTWLIDDVTYTADGLITVEMRDIGRLLVDQIAFPPVVPLTNYPMSFERERTVANPKVPQASTEWKRPALETSSNSLPTAATTTQFGHHPADAFDGSTTTYWLSRGHNAPSKSSSFEWIQGRLSGGQVMSSVRFTARAGPYRVYLSLFTNTAAGGKKTGWIGPTMIPYKKGVPPATGVALQDRKARIPYFRTATVKHNHRYTFNFPPVRGVTKVRLTFTNLIATRHRPGPYRAGVRDIEVALGTTVLVDGGTRIEGNYTDYAQIVKRLLAYGGFYWPQGGKQIYTGTNTRTFTFPTGDPYLAKSDNGQVGRTQDGRVWGDIKLAGTAGPAALGVEIWDKKPLLDGINYVKDILGYLFYVDPSGGAVFRPPNIYALGNWRADADGLNTVRTTDHVVLRDDEAIIGLRAKLSSRNLRERVFVADVSGKIGALARGRIPHPVNFRRVSGWTDQNFGTGEGIDVKEAQEQCQIMADLITLRQLFTFRTTSLTIPANPALQPDDQVRIEERTTGDSYFHYVRGISSSWELASRRWTYDMTTSWLGENPTGEWAFQTTDLQPETILYLQALGQI